MRTNKILKLNIFALFIEFELIDALLRQKYSQTCDFKKMVTDIAFSWLQILALAVQRAGEKGID